MLSRERRHRLERPPGTHVHPAGECTPPRRRLSGGSGRIAILEGSIAFTRKIDEAAACMYSLQQEVMADQDIPVQGVGRQPYRS